MNMTSSKPLSTLNRTRALIRIIKELDYIHKKTSDEDILFLLTKARYALNIAATDYGRVKR